MTDPVADLPASGEVFDGPIDRRYVALTLEMLIQDVSLTGDRETAMALGGYLEGAEPPPDGVPEYVDIEGDRITVTNPPFLRATVTLSAENGVRLEAAFDSDLNLLIEPPVTVTYRGPLPEAVADLEQTIAAIYRTRGRHLEKLHEGLVEK